jgi:two-component system, chemotaxis family, CheB/CheR fusion protein
MVLLFLILLSLFCACEPSLSIVYFFLGVRLLTARYVRAGMDESRIHPPVTLILTREGNKTMDLDEAKASIRRASHVVGIGASAGGLEAMLDLLRALPTTLGIAYIFLQHLDPHTASALPELLATVTVMPVNQAQDGLPVQADHVYVLPPQGILTISQGILHLHPRVETGEGAHTINTFLSSLAEDATLFPFGIILSGAGSDGTRGLQAIKAQGGITIAQDVATAKYPDMPRHALAAGCVDVVAPPEEIASMLTLYSQRFPLTRSPDRDVSSLLESEEAHLQAILRLVLERTDIDFTAYKPATIRRRLLHHLAMQHTERAADYLVSLTTHPEEIERLAQDLLVSVTGFFRDPEAFEAFTNTAFPYLMQHKVPGDSIRVWIMGCATGEEVYSLAICLLEGLGERAAHFPLSLFASDLDQEALAYARSGVYSPRSLAGLSQQRLERFFTKVPAGYQVSQALRERCVFARHNITRDPPFSRLDLVSCRNVLIYLGLPLQQKILSLFHYALHPDGMLLLGTSETIGSATHLFTPLDERWKLYAKKPSTTASYTFEYAIGGYGRASRTASRGAGIGENERQRSADLGSMVDQVLLTRHVPASVVVDHELQVVYLRGPTSRYFAPATGKASLHLLKMVRADLLLGLRTAISLAQQEGRAVKKELIQVDDEAGISKVMLEVVPLQLSTFEHFWLLLFTETAVPPMSAVRVPGTPDTPFDVLRTQEEWIRTLEQERVTLQDEATLLVAELEEANQELQAASEDIRSHNEELQSTNEELETSKEELQVINDELQQANRALQSSNERLRVTQQYAEAVVETVREPLLILDANLRVIHANHAFYQSFQTVPETTEQSLLDSLGNGQWNIATLLILLKDILPTNHTVEGVEVDQTFPVIGHKTFLLNARRLDWEGMHPPHILLAFEDITERKAHEQQKDDFIRIAGHELNTPVTSLKAYGEILWSQFRRAGDDRAAQVLAKMNGQIDRLIDLLREVLDVTQLETGQLPVHRERFDVQALLRERVEEIGRTTQTHRIALEEQDACWVDADPKRIGQVVTNLLSNAIKYAPAAPLIGVRLTTVSGVVTCSVQDGGPGIAPDKHMRLFKRFSRINSKPAESSQGLGLGLYLAAQLVERHGGRIWVESEEGKGTTFLFTLPLSSVLSGTEGSVETR